MIWAFAVTVIGVRLAYLARIRRKSMEKIVYWCAVPTVFWRNVISVGYHITMPDKNYVKNII